MHDGHRLEIFGRAFDGFERSLTDQLGRVQVEAGHRLLEIEDLQREVVEGTLATDGRADVLMLITDWLPSLIESGKILPLDQPQEDWVPALRALQTGADGRSYGVAYHDGPMLFLYRTDLYGDERERKGFADRFGYPLAPPVDWAQYRDQALWFDRPGEQRGTLLAGHPDEHNNVYDFLTHLWSRGGELIEAGGTSGLGSAAAAEAVDFLHGLWHVDRVVDPAAAGWDSVSSGVHFAAGEAAMMVNWAGFASMCDSGTVGCAPVPGSVTMNAYWVLTIPAGARDPERSAELIRQLTTHEMDVITAVSGGSATRRDSWADPRVRALAPYYAVLEDAHDNSRSVPVDARWPQMAAVLNEMMRAVVEDAAGRAALDKAHAELSELLAR
ncbi:extracellular solute-binding protein [Paractinoplanes lichenicola]|uniref:Extracellular solute-binding protein n=1 Tax=Paractinoplanes lichenicola TaxID=2802976 RepID=A0ABS1VNB7_9ACTN|nr:extracellular solute-binding protein [Actinoplanes lichenicola]MBL7256232.1 extracellular solute-binding protein [Actinoplanes lichenicola]